MKTQEELVKWNERRLALQRARKKRWKDRNREAFRAQRRRAKKARRERNRLGITLQGSKPLTGDAIASKYLRLRAKQKARKDYHREYLKGWRSKNVEKVRECHKRHYRKHREEIKAKAREATRKKYAMIAAQCAVDSELYAVWRAKRRVQLVKGAIKAGRIYRPRYARRIPDWAVMGGGVDYASPWLIENLTPSQQAYVRELAIERRERRDA